MAKEKVYKVLTEEELLKEADRLSKAKEPEVRDFGIALKDAILSKFVDVTTLFQKINTLLFVGGPTLSICIGVIIGVVLLLVTLLPFVTIASLLKGQKRFLRSMMHNPDKNAEKYFLLLDDIDEGKIPVKKIKKEIKKANKKTKNFMSDVTVFEGFMSYSEDTGRFSILTEAPKEIEPDKTTTDYTAEADADGDVEDEDEPEEEEDAPEDEPTDYTEDPELTDGEPEAQAEEEPDDTPAGEEETAPEDAAPDDNVETGEEDTPAEDETGEEDPEAGAEEPTDYTEDPELTGDGEGTEGEDTGEDTTTDDTTAEDDTTTDDTEADPEETKNSIVKNYNLMIDLRKVYSTTSDILNSLTDVIYDNPIQNQVLERCVENLQVLMDQILHYVEFTFSEKYETNLYYYNVFLQALKLNLEILKKNRELEDSNDKTVK